VSKWGSGLVTLGWNDTEKKKERKKMTEKKTGAVFRSFRSVLTSQQQGLGVQLTYFYSEA
jgi:hypothetical protein